MELTTQTGGRATDRNMARPERRTTHELTSPNHATWSPSANLVNESASNRPHQLHTRCTGGVAGCPSQIGAIGALYWPSGTSFAQRVHFDPWWPSSAHSSKNWRGIRVQLRNTEENRHRSSDIDGGFLEGRPPSQSFAERYGFAGGKLGAPLGHPECVRSKLPTLSEKHDLLIARSAMCVDLVVVLRPSPIMCCFRHCGVVLILVFLYRLVSFTVESLFFLSLSHATSVHVTH